MVVAIVSAKPTTAESRARLRFMAELAERASGGLVKMGFGPARFQPSGKYIPIRWPTGLWYHRFTQNDDVHVFVTADRIALRVHIVAYHGDRARNNRAFDLVRAEISEELNNQLPRHAGIDWRAARRGNNQVCAVYRGGGVTLNDLDADANWLIDCARAWLQALMAHPMPDLNERVCRIRSSPRGPRPAG